MPETITQAFNVFYENIQLTDNQIEDAVTKYKGVASALHKEYYPNTSYTGATKVLVGSYGKETYIRPPSDIDMIFVLPEGEFVRYEAMSCNAQSQLLQDIRNILIKTYPDTDVKAREKVVLVDFNGHKVEVIPAWKRPNGFYRIPDTPDGGCWQEWDYDGENAKIKNLNKKRNGKVLKLIKMIKCWARNITAPDCISSYTIENHVINFLSVYNPKHKTMALVTKDFFRYMSYVVEQEGKTCIDTAFGRAEKACDYQGDGNLEAASDEWRKIFGDDFPKVYVNNDEKSELLETYPSLDEEYLFEQNTPVRINSKYNLSIECLAKQDGWRKKSIDLLPFLKANKGLEFTVCSTNIPPPYYIKWKVRNFGEEALLIDKLRGKIEPCNKGYDTRTESTLYNGEHYVECYAIKDGACVAMDIMSVPIQK